MQMNDYPLGKIVGRLAARGITQLLVSVAPQERFATCSITGRSPAE